MNNNILDKGVQNYINANLNADVNQIALAKSPFDNVTAAELANQINAKKKAEKKLPSWYVAENIYYPQALSVEQTSSEVTAKYKSKLIKGKSLIDVTGGFGVDSFYFAKNIHHVVHCEINAELSKIAEHNAKILGANNIDFIAGDGLEFIKTSNQTFDTIYIDPARRAEKGKVFMLKDCTPDVVSNLNLLLAKAERVIIKTAPLLDITAGLSELTNVSEIHIISVKNECKELIWVIDKRYDKDIKIAAVTINEKVKEFSFSKSQFATTANFAEDVNLEKYLYEPDAALLKSGAFNLIATQYNLRKLQQQTQLYISQTINNNFPGRIFEIEEIISSGELKSKKLLKGNVIVRNYPAKAEDLIRKYKISSSNDKFLIFTKNYQNQNIIIKASIIQYY
ncbi:THUMP-like domain-containing protein [Pedobacter jejuensis]|uniref:Uncharacterized protein n=1 Tax=Pedobacter jejuensis TaxID=1268550 RepID=A0A3N0C1N8_9SPHI|nr:class I SAM-dependent methyltransferase [Pedobacter jejuensis]RNL56106.1 hypothetical protein D7004_02465 [Pedobacter jejuensis]